MLPRGGPARPPTPHTAAATRGRRRLPPPPPPLATLHKVEIFKVEPSTVAIEVHDVIGPPRIVRGVQHLGQTLERAQGAAHPGPGPATCSAPPRTSRLATDRNGTPI